MGEKKILTCTENLLFTFIVINPCYSPRLEPAREVMKLGQVSVNSQAKSKVSSFLTLKCVHYVIQHLLGIRPGSSGWVAWGMVNKEEMEQSCVLHLG